ncbi:MAG TPA: hypothetical protein VL285_01065 [Bryobacteraceae bacterium]|nr:hypothetical protein [Bryobacteraceae bacterium]
MRLNRPSISAAAVLAGIWFAAAPCRGEGESGSWNGFAGNAQHTAQAPAKSQPLQRIRWQTPVDLNPQYAGNSLLAHYGSPLVTPANTVIVPVKTGETGGFRLDARKGVDGSLVWSLPTDYVLPLHNWTPPYGPVLTPASRLYFPGADGTVFYRDQPDSPEGDVGQIAFYGWPAYSAGREDYDGAVMINTPLTSDSSGVVYFGFAVAGPTPLGLASGIARIGPDGESTWISAAAASADPVMSKVAQNCAPALSPDGRLLYVAVSNAGAGYLLALDSRTLQPISRVRLTDPNTGRDAVLSDDGSASPVAGPDGDVYYGVLENPFGGNRGRGWLLHFDAFLTRSKTPASFGWDTTPSLVPTATVASYNGSSPYLLMTKYNNYPGLGGDGANRIAVLDPGASNIDEATGVPVMTEVLTALGLTPDGEPPAVKEWCINSAAVDPESRSVLAHSEDGKLYRWDLESNSLSESVTLTDGLGEAYTPTIVGVDGTVYAISNAILFAVGEL